MKILMIHPERDEKYGAVHSMLEMLTNLEKNHHVTPLLLISKEGFVSDYCKKMNWEYHITGHANFMIGASTKRKVLLRTILLPLIYIRYKIKNYFALRLASKYINFDDIDLIHTNTSVCDFGALLANKYNKPHFWHLREIGNISYNRISLRKNYIDFMNKNTTNFIAISKAVKDEFVKMGIDERKISVIYNGVSLPNDINDKKIDNSKIKMVMSGSISEGKGQYLLIDAISKLPYDIQQQIDLDIIGDGSSEYVNSIKAIVNNNNLNNIIHFCGYKANVRELLPNYDIGFICSRAEGFGRVVIEYMMAGLCTISSDTGALQELIRNNYNGILFNYPNSLDLKDKILYVINNQNIIKEISNNAKKYAFNHFTDAINAKNIYNNYIRILGDYYEKSVVNNSII